MNKPTLLYASPFPPMKSGISDYSVVLVKALADKFDITLFTDNYDITEESINKFSVMRYSVDNVDFDSFDYILYNMGNNADFHSYIYETALEHPGVIIQHDLVLYHFINELYKRDNNIFYSQLYKKFDYESFISIKEANKKNQLGNMLLASKLPLNEEILKSGNRFIVHSEYTKNKILERKIIDEKDICKINHISLVDNDLEYKYVDKHDLFNKYNVPEDAILICAFGYIQNTKLNLETIRVVKRISKYCKKKICYVMVGKGDYVDEELEENLIIKTGFTELEEFDSFVNYSDIIVNLRYPTMGETSGAMIRILQMGKPCITNNGGWFSEIPDECVCKIGLENIDEDLEEKLSLMILNDEYRESKGTNARDYIKYNFNGEVISRQMFEFISEK